MKVSDFHYDLPDELIARYPLEQRSASRLLTLDGPTGATAHRQFRDLLDLVNPGDLLVFNNTRVIPARLFGQKETGGRLEILGEFAVTGREDALFCLSLAGGAESVLDLLERVGHMPLPPYVDRPDDEADRERYQTVYAREAGAVAAPTAGLHFDETLMAELAERGVEQAFVTLHVGAGTFQPVRVDDIRDHHMHSEVADVPQATVEAVQRTRARGGRVIAVGTTSVRSLESASVNGELTTFQGETDIFIYPGYRFRCVDALVTNFHLPESTLIMLVSAFAGYDPVMAAYREAVDQHYRFFSYGDAMFVTGQLPSVAAAAVQESRS